MHQHRTAHQRVQQDTQSDDDSDLGQHDIAAYPVVTTEGARTGRAGLARPVVVDRTKRDHRSPTASPNVAGWMVLTIVVGATLLGLSFAAQPGDTAFYPALRLAATWLLGSIVGGNPVLVFAAALLGLVVGLQRRAVGGVLGPT